MVAIEIHSDQIRKLERVLANIENGATKALVPAINRALASGKTVVKREIRRVYNIKAKDIPVTEHRANSGNLNGSIRIDQGMLGLDKFKVRPKGVQHRKNKRPIFAQVKKTGGGIIQGAFYIPQGGPYSRIGPSRFPIYKIATISAAIMATQPAVGPAVNERMGEVLDKRLDHEMKRVLAGAQK